MWRSFAINTALIAAVAIFLFWKNGAQDIEPKNLILGILLIPALGFAITMKYKVRDDALNRRRGYKKKENIRNKARAAQEKERN